MMHNWESHHAWETFRPSATQKPDPPFASAGHKYKSFIHSVHSDVSSLTESVHCRDIGGDLASFLITLRSPYEGVKIGECHQMDSAMQPEIVAMQNPYIVMPLLCARVHCVYICCV